MTGTWTRYRGGVGALIAFFALLACVAVYEWLFGPLTVSPWWPRAWVLVSAATIGVLLFTRKEETHVAALSIRERFPWRVLSYLCLVVLVFSLLEWPVTKDALLLVRERLKPEVVAPPLPPSTVSMACVTKPPTSSASDALRPRTARRLVASASLDLDCSVPLGALVNKTFSASSSTTDRIQEDLNRWGTLFAWLLAAVALVIAFVTSWVYAIAKEAKDQVTAVHSALDLSTRVREARSTLARVELHADIATLLDELDPDEAHVERQRLRSIRNLISTGESLLEPATDFHAAAAVLNAKAISLSAATQASLDSRYRRFLRNRLNPYLEGLHERLTVSRLAQFPAGQACIAEVEKVWRISRE